MKNNPDGRRNFRRYSHYFLRVFFSFLFALSLGAKYYGVHKLQLAIVVIPVIGKYAVLLSYCIIALEAFILIALVFFKKIKPVLVLTLSTLLTYSLFLVYVLTLAEHKPCACGGVFNFISWKGHLIFNSSLILLAATGLYCRGDPTEIEAMKMNN